MYILGSKKSANKSKVVDGKKRFIYKTVLKLELHLKAKALFNKA